MNRYTTKAKDTWDIIAKKTLGSEFLANQLIDANFKYSQIVFFKAGIILNIPEIILQQSTVNLPPWRR